MTTKTRIMILIEQTTEAPDSGRAGDTELVRARPIRSIRTTDSSERLRASIDGLAGWLAKAAS